MKSQKPCSWKNKIISKCCLLNFFPNMLSIMEFVYRMIKIPLLQLRSNAKTLTPTVNEKVNHETQVKGI